MNKLIEFTLMAGFIIAFLMFFLLLSKKKKTVADIVLAVWIFVIGIHILGYYAYFSEFTLKYPHLLGTFVPLNLIHGPLLFLYILTLIKSIKKFPKIHFVHFLPCIINYLIMIPFFIASGEEKISLVYGESSEGPPLIFIIIQSVLYLSGPFYIVWSIILMNRHKKNIKKRFSYTDEIDLKWIRTLIFALIFIWLVIFIFDAVDYMINMTIPSEVFIFISLSISTLFLGYYGFKQTTIFSDIQMNNIESHKIKEEKILEKTAYKRSGLKDEEAEKYLDKLKTLMESEKLYLEAKLSLNQLATKLNISTNNLSQLINEKLDQNFYEFVNSYRIKEIKQKLVDPKSENYTLLALAYDCGFNSKSSFNNIFKKFTGKTPKEFQKEYA